MAKNPANLWDDLPPNGPWNMPYVPSSYHLFLPLVNSEGVSPNIHAVDVVSGTQEDFTYTCPSGHNAAIFRMNFNAVDGLITPTKFAGIAALPNGLKVQHLNSIVGSRETITDFLGGMVIKINADWSMLSGVDDIIVSASPGDDEFNVRWSVYKSGAPTHLTEGEQFAICLQDSTDGITQACAMVQGLVYPNT